MMNHASQSDDSAGTPAELRGVEARLARLASAERGAAAPGFEARLARASLPALTAPSVPLKFPARWRLAAAVAVVGGAGLIVAAWMASRTAGPGAPALNPPLASRTSETEPTEGAIDPATLREELDELLTTWESDAELVRAETADESFWESDESLTIEEPIQ